MDGSYTTVELWIGEAHHPRCVADVFDGDVLTITAIDTDEVLRTYQPGEWKSATTYTAGYPAYSHRSRTEVRAIVNPFDLMKKGAA